MSLQTPEPPSPDDPVRGWHARIWRLAFPIILANISTPLLGLVDTAVMGHLPDPRYLSAVAVGAVVFSMLFWGFGFLRMGTTGLTAQAYGARNNGEIAAAFTRAAMIALGLAAILLTVQGPIGRAALWFFPLEASTADLVGEYYAIRIWAAPATLLNYVIVGWLIGLQRGGLALILQLVLNGTNIAFDLILVVGFGMTVDGVALATVIAETTAAIAGLGLVAWVALSPRAGDRSRPQWPGWAVVLDRKTFTRLLSVNTDILIRTLALISGFAWFTHQGTRLGEVTLAANAVLLNFQTIAAYALDGFAFATESLVGAAKGARRRSRFDRVVVASTTMAMIFAIAFTLIFLIGGRWIIDGLTSITEVRNEAYTVLVYAALGPVLSVASFQLDGIFIGTTRTKALRNAMLASLAMFMAATVVLVPLWGNHGLWVAFLFFMAARAVTLGMAYPRLRRDIPEGTASTD